MTDFREVCSTEIESKSATYRAWAVYYVMWGKPALLKKCRTPFIVSFSLKEVTLDTGRLVFVFETLRLSVGIAALRARPSLVNVL